MTSLPKLKELALDGNPCASKPEFTYEMIMRMPKLKLYNDDAVKELDRDVAAQYLEMHGIILDLKPVIKVVEKVEPLSDITATLTKKSVTFKMNPTESDD